MNLYIWRHSTRFASWSMLDEQPVYDGSYSQAEVIVLAPSRQKALQLLEQQGKWNVEALEQIEPQTLPLDEPRIIAAYIE